jgi:hypothetical protein
VLTYARPAVAGSAPPWLAAVAGAPLPAHDDKTDAVLLYSEENLTVVSTDRVKRSVRKAYKILRPGGREYGEVAVSFNSHRKITSLHGWCIPAQGKDYEVKDKDALEISLHKVEGSELVSDVKAKLLRIPASDPGNVIGYEYEAEEQPYVLQDMWEFQQESPARESHYSLSLPSGWECKTFWFNYPEAKPAAGGGEWHWTVGNVSGIRPESAMPPEVAGYMVVSFFPPGGSTLNEISNWQKVGDWYRNLTNGRFNASPDIKQEVASLTAAAPTQLEKMRIVARFVQQEIRYVAISLGIGGLQPHAAADTFTHRYGDCKDKATLLSSMLGEIGVASYYVIINSQRGAVAADTPAHLGAFDHAILAVKLPEGLSDPSLVATLPHARYGKLLFFDPTEEFTPFGSIGGYLQGNYGLLVGPDGGELVELPTLPSAMNGIQRTGKLALNASGNLQGEIKEMRLGDQAWAERARQRAITQDTDRIKSIETLLGASLSNFQISKAFVINRDHADLPFGFGYTISSDNYAKHAGNLLLVRPRVLGVKSSALLETPEPRKYAIEFEGLERDTDSFEIELPPGYEVDELPLPVDVDYSFASYHAKTEFHGNTIGYSRVLEIKELSVPVAKAEDLKRFYRIIASDERNTATLKPK